MLLVCYTSHVFVVTETVINNSNIAVQFKSAKIYMYMYIDNVNQLI